MTSTAFHFVVSLNDRKIKIPKGVASSAKKFLSNFLDVPSGPDALDTLLFCKRRLTSSTGIRYSHEVLRNDLSNSEGQACSC